MVRSSYERLIGRGELQARSFVALTLGEALEFSVDAAAKGLPLSSWNGASIQVFDVNWCVCRLTRTLFICSCQGCFRLLGASRSSPGTLAF